MRTKSSPLLIYVDFALNRMLGFAALFFVAFLLINPKAVEQVERPPSEDTGMITMDWNPENNSDFDIHVAGPNSIHLWFRQRDSVIGSLERDDRGYISDEYTNENGEQVLNKINREVIHLKTMPDGKYIVNIHYYDAKNSLNVDQNISYSFLQITPTYKVLIEKKLNHRLEPYEEYTLFSFEVKDGHILPNIDTSTNIPFVKG